MSVQRWIHVLVSIAVGAVTVACDTSTEPVGSAPIDLGSALADYEAMDAILSSDGFAGFRALANRTPFAGSPAAIEGVGKVADGPAAQRRALGRALAGYTSGNTNSAAGAPIISDLHRGATFVYDPETDDYVVDPERPGAPTTGVRFIIYQVDVAGRPLVDHEIGHADLVDEGDGSLEDIILHMIVTEGSETILDYRTALDDTGSGGTLAVLGFVSGDNIRLDFDIDAVGTQNGARSSLDLTFDLRINARGFHVAGSVRGVDEGTEGEGDIEVTVRHGDKSLRVDVSGDQGIIDGSVELNGQLFATVSGPADDPTFLGSSGEPLTGAEFLVLWHVLDSVEDVFDLLEDLLDPVDELVFLGAIL